MRHLTVSPRQGELVRAGDASLGQLLPVVVGPGGHNTMDIEPGHPTGIARGRAMSVLPVLSAALHNGLVACGAVVLVSGPNLNESKEYCSAILCA